jgi:hypothetical protein
MRHLVVFLAVAAIATGTARAEQARPADAGRGQPFALAVNVLPVAPDAFAVSAWVGRDAHNAIRANVARYRGPLWLRVLAPIFSDGEDGDVAPDFGSTTDLGLGWVYYPRRLLDGVSVEAGVLCRFDRQRNYVDDQNASAEEHHTNAYSGRFLVGWTWRLSEAWFLATAAGGALGYDRGREKAFAGVDDHGDVSRSRPVSRVSVSLESYVRLGMAFGQ